MTVHDASVVADALAVAGPAGDAARASLDSTHLLQVPQIMTAEVTSALRSLVMRGDLAEPRARAAVASLRSMRTMTYPIDPFLDRVWALRDQLTVYDAWYVALAESLETDLVTADERLAKASAVRCEIRLLG